MINLSTIPTVTGTLIPEDVEEFSTLLRKHTGFPTISDLVDAKGSYRPTICVQHPCMERLADLYDQWQESRGDERRAYRYGRERRNLRTYVIFADRLRGTVACDTHRVRFAQRHGDAWVAVDHVRACCAADAVHLFHLSIGF